MSGIYDENRFKCYRLPVSGTFLPERYHQLKQNLYEGVGISHNVVTCKFCDSKFVLTKESCNCKNCGATY